MPPVLEARDLCKAFGPLQVTRNVSLSLPPGRRHAVIGPNGAGKTTLFNLLTGETAADSGSVLVDGTAVDRLGPDGRARAGLARSFQRNSLFPDMTVRENLITAVAVRAGVTPIFWLPLCGRREVLARAEDLAGRLGLGGVLDTPVRHLSYGTQRQVEVGLALALDPRALLLDEPTAGMSPEETRAMQALIAGLPSDLAVIIIEHDMDVVFGLAERITVLDYGSVLLEGAPEEVRGSDLVRERYLGGGP